MFSTADLSTGVMVPIPPTISASSTASNAIPFPKARARLWRRPARTVTFCYSHYAARRTPQIRSLLVDGKPAYDEPLIELRPNGVEARQLRAKSLSFALHFSFACTKSGVIETPRSGRPHVQAYARGFCERGYGEIGRHARFRFWCRKAWEFKSLYPHHYRACRRGDRKLGVLITRK